MINFFCPAVSFLRFFASIYLLHGPHYYRFMQTEHVFHVKTRVIGQYPHIFSNI